MSDIFSAVIQVEFDKSSADRNMQNLLTQLKKTKINLVPNIDFAKIKIEADKTIKELSKSLQAALKTDGIELSDKQSVKIITDQYKETAKAIKEIERQSYQEQQKYYGKISDSLREIYRLKRQLIHADTEETAELNKQIKAAQQRVRYNQQQLEKKGLSTDALTYETNSIKSAYENQLKLNQARAEDKSDRLEKIRRENEALKAQKELAQSVRLEQQKENAKSNIDTFVSQNSKLKGSSEEAERLRTQFLRLRAEIDRADDSTALANLKTQISTLKNETKSAGLIGRNFIDEFKNDLSKLSYWMSATTLLFQTYGQIRQAVVKLKEMDTILTEISKTSERTASSIRNLGQSAFDVANVYGRKASDYLLGVQEMSRAGMDNQSEDMAKLSLLAQSAGDMNVELANDYLIATDAAYKLNHQVQSLNNILDGQNMVTNRNAVSMTDLAEATKITASQSASSGVAIDKTTAALATMISTTRQGGDIAARAWKGILMNLQQVSGTIDEESGEIINTEDLTKYESACNALGVSLKEVKNGIVSLRDPMQIIKELAKAYTSLDKSDSRRANLINAVGGKYRGNQLNALLENYDVYEKMLKDYSEGNGSAFEEAMKSANNWEGTLNKLYNTWTDFIQNFTNTDVIISAINIVSNFVHTLDVLTEQLGAIPSITMGLGIFKSIKNTGFFSVVQSSSDETRKSLALLGKDISAIKSDWQNASGVKNKLFSLFDTQTSDKDIQALNRFNTEIDKGMSLQTAYNRTMLDASESAQTFAATSRGGTVNIEAFAEGEKTAKTATIGLTIAQTALNAAIGLGIGLLISFAINGIDNFIHAQEKAIEKSADTLQTFKEQQDSLQNSKKTIDDIADDYSRLAKGVDTLGKNVNLNTEEYSKYNEIVNQIASVFPQMIQGYTAEGNAIIAHKGNIEALTQAYKEQKKAAQDAAIVQSREVFKGYKAKTDKDAYFVWEKAGLNQQKELLQTLLANSYDLNKFNGVLSKIGTAGSQFSKVTAEQTLSAVGLDYVQYDESMLTDAKSKLSSGLHTVITQLDAETAKIKPVMSAYLESSYDYQSLSAETQEIVRQIVNQFDSSFYQQFGSETEMSSWVTSNLVNLFKGEDGQKIAEAFNKTLKVKYDFEDGKLSAKEYLQQLNKVKEATADLETQTKKSINLIFDIKTDDGSDLDVMMRNVKLKLKEEFQDKVGELSISDLKIAYSLENTGRMTWDELTDKINSSTEGMKKAIPDLDSLTAKLDNLKTAYQTVSAAIQEYNKNGVLSTDTYESLLQLKPEMLRYLTDETGNLNLTTDALNTYTDALIEQMVQRQLISVIDYVSGLSEEERQTYLTAQATDTAVQSTKDFTAALIQEKLIAGQLVQEDLPKLQNLLNNIMSWGEAAKEGIHKNGLDKTAAETNKKLREEIAKTQSDLAKKEEDFAEKMAEAWEKEYLERLKDDLKKHQDILDQYQRQLDSLSFGVSILNSSDTQSQQLLLQKQLDTIDSYGSALADEFTRVSSLSYSTGSEAQEIADTLTSLGEKMRSNVSAFRQTIHELDMLRITSVSSVIDNRIAELDREMTLLNTRLSAINQNGIYGKLKGVYTSQITANIDSFLPTMSDLEKGIQERKNYDQQIIQQEQTTRSTINQIVSASLAKQSEENAQARAKERTNLLKDIETARAEAKKKIDEAYAQLNSSTRAIAASVENTINTMDLHLPQIDVKTAGEQALTEAQEYASKIQRLFDNELQGNRFPIGGEGQSGGAGSNDGLVSAAVNALGSGGSPGYNQPNQYNNYTNSAWCGYFVDAMAKQAGKSIPSHQRVADGVGQMKKNGTFASPTMYQPVPGDYIYFTGSSGTYGHVGIVTDFNGDTISFIDGNNSSGKVKKRSVQYGAKNITGFGITAGYAEGGVVPSSEPVFVGEDGVELAKEPDGTIHIVGKDGIELAQFPAGTEIIPNEQAKEILANPVNYADITTRHAETVYSRQTQTANGKYRDAYTKYIADKKAGVFAQDEGAELTALTTLSRVLSDEKGTAAVQAANDITDQFLRWMEDVNNGTTQFDTDIFNQFSDAITKYTELASKAEDDISQAIQNAHAYWENNAEDIINDTRHSQTLRDNRVNKQQNDYEQDRAGYNSIKDIAHKRADDWREFMRDMLHMSDDEIENSDEVQKWQQIWWEADQEIIDSYKTAIEERTQQSEEWISREESLGNLDTKNKLSAYTRILKYLKEYQNQILSDETLTNEQREKLWSDSCIRIGQYNQKIYEANLNIEQTAYQQTIAMIEAGEEKKRKALEKTHQEISDEYDDLLKKIDAVYDKEKTRYQELRDRESYQKDLSAKEKEAAVLQKRLDALSLDDSDKANATKLSLRKELSEKLEEIEDLKHAHELEQIEKSLDDANNAYHDYFDQLGQQEDDAYDKKLEDLEKEYSAQNKHIEAMTALQTGYFTVIEEDGTKTTKKLSDAFKDFAIETGTAFDNMGQDFQNLIDQMNLATKILNENPDLFSYAIRLKNGDFDSFGAGSGGSSSTSSTPTHNSSYDSGTYSPTVSERDTIMQMIQNSSAYNETDNAVEREKYHNENEQLGLKIGAQYDPVKGIWYKNGLPLYHSGKAGINSKEELAVILKNETVMTKPQIEYISDKINCLSQVNQLVKDTYSSIPYINLASGKNAEHTPSTIIYSPQTTIKGNADKKVIEKVNLEVYDRFKTEQKS